MNKLKRIILYALVVVTSFSSGLIFSSEEAPLGAYPKIEVTSPLMFSITYETSIDIEGIAKGLTEITSVTIKGKDSKLEGERFYLEGIPLELGENRFLIWATDSQGKRRALLYTIYRQEEPDMEELAQEEEVKQEDLGAASSVSNSLTPDISAEGFSQPTLPTPKVSSAAEIKPSNRSLTGIWPSNRITSLFAGSYISNNPTNTNTTIFEGASTRITPIIPYDNSTLRVGDNVTTEVTSLDQNTALDTTPPTAPVIEVGATSNSLNSLSTSWSSEDPESGIVEYQYAIGTTEGGTDLVYWTAYGNNTQAFISDLNLTKGEDYYLSAVAKNGAGLKSPVTTSPPIRAEKELYLKINYPYQNAIITEREVQIKGVAEGINQITVNGKPVAVNPDGTFEGPTLVAPGYATRRGITSSDPNYIIMRFPKETSITASAGGEEDTVLFYYTQFPLKARQEQEIITIMKDIGTLTGSIISEYWNSDSLSIVPFAGWADESKNERYTRTYSNSPERNSVDYYRSWRYDPSPLWYGMGKMHFYLYDRVSGRDVIFREDFVTGKSDCFIHTPPAVEGKIRPLVLILFDCTFLEPDPWTKDPPPFNLESYKVNGQPLKSLYGDPGYAMWGYPHEKNAYYVVLTDYEPDSDLQLKVEAPYYPERINQPEDMRSMWQQWFMCDGIDALRLDIVREIPYGSGNYVPVNTIPIFQPDDGKGRGPSLGLVNMPFLKLKFNQEPSDLQINTLQAKLTIAKETKTYDLTETTADSGIFTSSDNSFTLSLQNPNTASLRGSEATEAISVFNPNLQDEITCSVTSSFGNLNNKLFNLKESASDSLYFNDVKTFVTVIFNSELLSYQNDSLTLRYSNGLSTSEEILTETSPESLIFINNNQSLSVILNNYTGFFPDILDISIPNSGYLGLSRARVYVTKIESNPYVYTNNIFMEPVDAEPIDPAITGEGVFRLRLTGLPSNLSADELGQIDVKISDGSETKNLALANEADGSYVTERLLLLAVGDNTTFDGITSLHALGKKEELELFIKNNSYDKIDASRSAFIGQFIREFETDVSQQVLPILREELGYFALPFNQNPGVYVALSKADVLKGVPNNSVWFTTSHGQREIGTNGSTFKGFYVRYENKGQNDIMIKPEDISGARGTNEYKLVFLNSCWSALPGGELFKEAFNATTYLGWAIDTTSYEWAPVEFFKQCVDNDVQQAVINTNKIGRKSGAMPEEKYRLKILGDGVGVDINLNHERK